MNPGEVAFLVLMVPVGIVYVVWMLRGAYNLARGRWFTD